MNRLFAESFINRDDHYVLRRRLLPLSLWHMLHLELAGSPYFYGESFPGPRDLRLAVSICTTAFPMLPDLSDRRLIINWLRAYGCAFLRESRRFAVYLQDFSALPQLWRQEEKSLPGSRKPVGLPWALAIVSSVCGSTGWSAETVWNMPIGQAYWYHVAFAMHRGCHVDLLNEGEMLAIQKVMERKLNRAGRS